MITHYPNDKYCACDVCWNKWLQTKTAKRFFGKEKGVMTKPKARKFWDDLDRQREMFPERFPITTDGFTLPEYMRRYKLTRGQARVELDRLTTLGKIVKIGIRPGGAHENAYILK